MSNNHKNTAIGRIFALAVLIAGTCSIAATAWATTCFLPSGNCSTGRVGNDGDGGGSGGGEKPEDTCKDVEGNFVSKSDYDLMSPTSCFKCSTCETNNQTKYRCAATIGSNWDGKHCCGLDLKWDNDASKCCSILLGCPTLCISPKVAQGKKCVCPEGRAETTSGNCCLVGQTAHGNLCCNAGEKAYTTICCPTNKHEEGGTCVCDANYENDGTGCKPIDKCKGYDLTASQAAQYNNNCYSCSNCNSNTAKYKCEVRSTPLNGYKLENGVCSLPTPSDPNNGKTYYVVLDRDVKATTNNDAKDCRFTVEGKITYPNTAGDTFMNNVYFGAQIAGYIDYKYIGSGGEDDYQNKAFTIPVQNLMSNVNNYTRTAGYGDESNTGSPLPCIYESEYGTYSALNASNFWVGFKEGQPLYVNTNKLDSGYSQRCKTISKDGSSRTICVKYSDEMHYCSYWGLENQSSANCSYGYTFIQDKEHPTDDYNNTCGTCVKNVGFFVNTIDCGGSAARCDYFYPCTSTTSSGQQCYQCVLSLYKNTIVIWIDNEGKIKYMKKNGTYYSAPFSDEYVVLTTMNDYSGVADNLGTMEGWNSTSKFDNNIGQRRGFYELYIEQKHSDNTSQCYLSTDESLTIWKRGNPDKSECKKEKAGYTSGKDDYAFGVGSGGRETLSNSDIKKMFPGKTINDTTTNIDISGTTGNGSIIMSKYVWYRVTDAKPGDNINIYPRCYRDVDLLKGLGGRCYFGWKGMDSSLGNYTNCKNLK